MSSLSSSTLNLKFMQRAAARNAPTTPSTPSSTSTRPAPPASSSFTPDTQSTQIPPLGQDTPSRHSKVDEAPIIPMSIGLQAEQEAAAKWFIPRSTASGSSSSLMGTGRVEGDDRVRFENSYLPFLMGDSEAGPSRLGRTSGGGGRMIFGGFGEAVEEPEEREEEGDADINVKIDKRREDQVKSESRERRVDGGRDDESRRNQESSKHKRPKPQQPHTTSSGFQRPANYNPDLSRPSSTSTPSAIASSSSSTNSIHPKIKKERQDVKPTINHQGHKRKPSTAADQLRDSTANKSSEHTKPKTDSNRTKSGKSAAVSSGVKVEGVKRVKLVLSAGNSPASISDTAATGGAGGGSTDLDAREKALKAEKKREKKAKRKMKVEEGVVVA